jgi:lipopolysaccharide/colanic/teichoic acid biosynthesis glycosyltransferase
VSLKRVFDLAAASAGIVILSPVLIAVALAIKADSPGGVFFRQIRIGRYGRPFHIFKFRTMVTDAEKLGPQVSSGDDPRITRIGSLLRKYKIDELPQLLNVIIGDMSLVGPRPEVPRYVDAFRKEYDQILTIRPGITDYASLEFKDENELLSTADNPEDKYLREILPVKIEYCKKYLRDQSFVTDLRLIFRTIGSILS